MELRDYVEIGAKKAGSLTALGKLLDISQPTISGVKAHKRGLPIDLCLKLADYIGADRIEVISASELVTEKKPEKRAFWMQHAKAASIALAFGIAINFVAPSPAEAAQVKENTATKPSCNLYYVKYVHQQKVDGGESEKIDAPNDNSENPNLGTVHSFLSKERAEALDLVAWVLARRNLCLHPLALRLFHDKKRQKALCLVVGRGGGIRTHDPLLPKQMRYQAALRPDT